MDKLRPMADKGLALGAKGMDTVEGLMETSQGILHDLAQADGGFDIAGGGLTSHTLTVCS